MIRAVLTLYIISPTDENPKPCVQCDASLRALDKAGMVRGEDYEVKLLTDADRERFKKQDLLRAPVAFSDLLDGEDKKWTGFRPDLIKKHAAEHRKLATAAA